MRNPDAPAKARSLVTGAPVRPIAFDIVQRTEPAKHAPSKPKSEHQQQERSGRAVRHGYENDGKKRRQGERKLDPKADRMRRKTGHPVTVCRIAADRALELVSKVCEWRARNGF